MLVHKLAKSEVGDKVVHGVAAVCMVEYIIASKSNGDKKIGQQLVISGKDHLKDEYCLLHWEVVCRCGEFEGSCWEGVSRYKNQGQELEYKLF